MATTAKKTEAKQDVKKTQAKPAVKTPTAAAKEAAKKPAPKAEKPKAAAPAKPATKSRTVEKVFDTKTVKKASKPTVTTEALSKNFQQQIHKTFS